MITIWPGCVMMRYLFEITPMNGLKSPSEINVDAGIA
jgi:hypothetical protein